MNRATCELVACEPIYRVRRWDCFLGRQSESESSPRTSPTRVLLCPPLHVDLHPSLIQFQTALLPPLAALSLRLPPAPPPFSFSPLQPRKKNLAPQSPSPLVIEVNLPVQHLAARLCDALPVGTRPLRLSRDPTVRAHSPHPKVEGGHGAEGLKASRCSSGLVGGVVRRGRGVTCGSSLSASIATRRMLNRSTSNCSRRFSRCTLITTCGHKRNRYM